MLDRTRLPQEAKRVNEEITQEPVKKLHKITGMTLAIWSFRRFNRPFTIITEITEIHFDNDMTKFMINNRTDA